MAANLVVEGPFEIDYATVGGRAKRITSDCITDFWGSRCPKQFQKKRGCYIFAMGSGRGHVPWYVGLSSKGFKTEIFTNHKLVYYNDVIFQCRGKPVMFFVAPPGTKNVVPTPDLEHMEKELIQIATEKNTELCNVKNTKNLPRWSIKGVIRANRGRRPKEAVVFNAMMGIS